MSPPVRRLNSPTSARWPPRMSDASLSSRPNSSAGRNRLLTRSSSSIANTCSSPTIARMIRPSVDFPDRRGPCRTLPGAGDSRTGRARRRGPLTAPVGVREHVGEPGIERRRRGRRIPPHRELLAPGDRQGLVPAPRRTGRHAPAPRMAAGPPAQGRRSRPLAAHHQRAAGARFRPPSTATVLRNAVGSWRHERDGPLLELVRRARRHDGQSYDAIAERLTLTAARSPMTCGGCGTTARDHRAADPGSDDELSTAPSRIALTERDEVTCHQAKVDQQT